MVIHDDCARGTLSSRNDLLAYHLTQICVVRDIVEERISKAQDRTYSLYQEMNLLSLKSTSTQGNAGLARAAGYLFDPLISFWTIAQSAQAVAARFLTIYHMGGYVPGMDATDTVSSLQGLL